jgi:predicted GNAT family acetyltransferase
VLVVDGEMAGVTDYRGRGAVRAFTHTEVEQRFAGQGLGSTLIRGALDDVRAKEQHILPMCPFVRHFLDEHDEYLDLVMPVHRAAFGLPATAGAASSAAAAALQTDR